MIEIKTVDYVNCQIKFAIIYKQKSEKNLCYKQTIGGCGVGFNVKYI